MTSPRAAARGLVMVCANPDRVVQRGDRLIYCGGALAELYEALGGRTIMAGKPFAPIYDLALAEAARLFANGDRTGRVLAIGDGVATDIAGAQARSLDRLFVATGIHGAETMGTGRALSADAVETFLGGAGLTAHFAIGDLVWSGPENVDTPG